MRSGNIVKQPIKFANPTQARVEGCIPSAVPSISVIGKSGSRTFFSCTWYEQRKKPHDVAAKAGRRSLVLGRKRRARNGGMMPIKVASNAAF